MRLVQCLRRVLLLGQHHVGAARVVQRCRHGRANYLVGGVVVVYVSEIEFKALITVGVIVEMCDVQ